MSDRQSGILLHPTSLPSPFGIGDSPVDAKADLERDLEAKFPDANREIIMYCGGGYRSVLTAAAAQKLGFRNVYSLKGGYKGLLQAQWPMKAGE